MAEKRGNLIKLKYDFNTAWVCEIFTKNRWVRVLETDFRSFNGERRITKPVSIQLGNVKVPTETYTYRGDYYYHGTNTCYDPNEHPKDTIVYPVGVVRPASQRTTVAKI